MPSVPLMAIVDDNDALRDSLDNLLRSVGFRVQGFASAEAFLQANHAPETACLLLDVHLPGMNGLELQRQLMAARWPFCTNPTTRRISSMPSRRLSRIRDTKRVMGWC